MEKLNQIIESMALAKFKKDSSQLVRTTFVLKNTTLGEFIDFYQRKRTSAGTSWHIQYHDQGLNDLQGLEETFIKEVLWPKLKDQYIEDVVKGLENKLDAQYKVTIEQI